MKEVLYFAAICALVVSFISSIAIGLEFPRILRGFHEGPSSSYSSKMIVVFAISVILSLIFTRLSRGEDGSIRNEIMGAVGLFFCLPMIALFFRLLNFDSSELSEGTGGMVVAVLGVLVGEISIIISMLLCTDEDKLQVLLFSIGAAVFMAVFTSISIYVLVSESARLVGGTVASLVYSGLTALLLGLIGFVKYDLMD